MGGATAIVSTAPSGKPMSALIDGLDANGKFMTGASTEPIEVTPVQLISGRRSLQDGQPGLRLIRGYAELFRYNRSSAYDRQIPAGRCGEGLRSNDLRQSTISCGADDELRTRFRQDRDDLLFAVSRALHADSPLLVWESSH